MYKMNFELWSDDIIDSLMGEIRPMSFIGQCFVEFKKLGQNYVT